MKSMQHHFTGLTGRAQAANRGSSGAFASNEPAEATSYDRFIGQKVWTRWPEDNHFYEAVITDYNPIEVHFTLGLWNIMPITGLLFNTINFPHIDRGGMLWFMILIQVMKHGNGSISKRYRFAVPTG